MAQNINNRIAVTGVGAICGLGHSINDVWGGIIEGKSGISTIENMDTEKLVTKFGGEVKNFELSHEILAEKEQPRYDKFIHYSLQAGNEAMKNAGLLAGNHGYDANRMGCIMGVGIGGFPLIEKYHEAYLEKGLRRISPFFIPGIIPNMGAGMLSIKLGLKGINYSIASACASSAHALGSACYELWLGRHDMILCGGAEGVLSALGVGGFNVMKALSKRNEEPHKASRPFDSDRDGFVMGEGAGMLVLENYEKAKARGATILAEVVGFGASSDADHITAPNPEGLGASACMQQALSTGNISPEQIDYVNAHGTSTPLGDIAETKAIKKTFNDHAKNILVSSTKSMTGHLLGAAGGLEAVFCVKAIADSVVPPTINLDNQDPECDLNYVPNKAVNKKIGFALSNSFGFGGTNASVIVKHPDA